MEQFLVRKAKPEDAYGIAFVNAHTWYTAYQGLIPEKVLKARIDSIDERSEKIHEFIKNGKNYLVAKDTETNAIVGMLVCCPSRNNDHPNSGEIAAIYVLPKYQKLGIGKKLFLSGINELIELGYNDMIINVLEGNKAINFYQKYGGRVVGERYDQFGKKIMKEFILFFDDIKSIR